MSRSPGRGGPSALGRWNRLVAKSNAASNAVGSSGPSKACATYAHWRKRAAIAIGTSFGALTKDGVQMHPPPRPHGANLPRQRCWIEARQHRLGQSKSPSSPEGAERDDQERPQPEVTKIR